MAINNYDAKKVIVTVGALLMFGFQDGDKIKVTPEGDLYSMTGGVDGAKTRSRLNNDGGEIMIGLQYGSGANLLLEGLVTADLLTGLATVPIYIQDVLGGSTTFATSCFLKARPEVTIGREVSGLEWVFLCANISMTHGILIPSLI